jgi:hypothetical protein
MRIAIATISVLLPLIAGCSGWEGPRPESVPERMVLAPGLQEVLQVTFRADDSGYTIINMRRTTGAPTLGINQDNDVLVVAFGDNGDAVSSISVPNPRVVRTAGSTKPASAILSQAVFTVNFASPASIEGLRVSVRNGPNGELEQEFSLKDYRHVQKD